jgi:hypothetical protein
MPFGAVCQQAPKRTFEQQSAAWEPGVPAVVRARTVLPASAFVVQLVAHRHAGVRSPERQDSALRTAGHRIHRLRIEERCVDGAVLIPDFLPIRRRSTEGLTQ